MAVDLSLSLSLSLLTDTHTGHNMHKAHQSHTHTDGAKCTMASLTCAATVCDLVGNSLVMQAVLNPSSTRPKAALSPAPPAPTTTASYVWSTMS